VISVRRAGGRGVPLPRLPDSLPRLTTDCCPVCALPTPAAMVCGACLKKPPQFDATRAVFRYEFPLDRLVQSLKYAHRIASADFLGRILAPCRLATSARPDPAGSAGTAAARRAGFQPGPGNRAAACPPSWRLPLETRHVRRHIDTTPQAGLPWKERAKNIRHAFECDIDLSGKAVLVIDDVMTTGATLNELAGTLKACGAARIENLVVARTLKA
jgi:predicted amidophosphoribosyltransferase